jgi:quercetin dioxygenase-like cupin family protein
MFQSAALANIKTGDMEMTGCGKVFALIGLGLIFSTTAQAQSSKRTEVTKGDLTGTNMEIVVGIVEVPPGASGVLHTHPGEEAYYVIDSATAETPDGKQVVFDAGTSKINVREVPHGAFKVTGDKTLKLLTVHVVDKGKAMFTPVK